MQEYLALGPDTPMAQTFQQVLPAIEQGKQELGAPAGSQSSGMMPDTGQGPPDAGAQPPPEAGAQAVGALDMLTGDANTDFGNATKQAAADHKETGSYGKKKKSKGK